MELSPRTAPDAPGAVAPRRRRSPWAYGALVLVLVGIGVVAYQALTSASLYFYNADEAVAQADELYGDRIPGPGPRARRRRARRGGDGEPGITFTITFNGVDLPVDHRGRPPGALRTRHPGRAGG